MKTLIKNYSEVSQDKASLPAPWNLKVIIQDDNMTYLAMNEASKEAIFVDPVREDFECLLNEANKLTGYRILAVIDTHTHADHISCASDLAKALKTPLIMHEKAPSTKVDIRISCDTRLEFYSAALEFILSPGHTQDSLTVIWGPFVFTADTLLYGEPGRDDLPTGSGDQHYKTIQKLKLIVQDEQIFLPGHDGNGGRISSWKTQKQLNNSFNMTLEEYMVENGNWKGPAPKLLKDSLTENFK